MIKALIFDLDDTLVDTWNQMIPPALQSACSAMIEAGLNAQVDECVSFSRNYMRSPERTPTFLAVARKFGSTRSQPLEEIAKVGFSTFVHREVKESIFLSPETISALEHIQNLSYQTFLVTSGHPDTQKQKVEKLGLEKYFNQIFFTDKEKLNQFREILKVNSLNPEEVLVIGDRIDREIKSANELGMQSCRVLKGEHSAKVPLENSEIPDITIDSISELIEKCQL